MFWPGGLVCLGELDLQLLCCSVLVIAILVRREKFERAKAFAPTDTREHPRGAVEAEGVTGNSR